MRIQFFQRLLDLLCARVAVIRSDGEIALSSQLARRQLELEPGTRLEVLHREGERLLVRQPCTQQLHSATGLRWAAFEFVLFQAPPVGIDSELAVRHRMLTELCRQPRFQAALSAADRLALQSVLGSSRTSIQPAEQTKASRGLDPLDLIREALAPPLKGAPALYVQVPLPLGRLRGKTAGLAAALRSLTEELVLRHRSHRLLVRLRQEPDLLLINVQDIGDMELPGMRRLEIDGHWQGAPLDQVQACEVIEMYGGSLRIRGQIAQGRVSISLPTTDVPEVSTRLS